MCNNDDSANEIEFARFHVFRVYVVCYLTSLDRHLMQCHETNTMRHNIYECVICIGHHYPLNRVPGSEVGNRYHQSTCLVLGSYITNVNGRRCFVMRKIYKTIDRNQHVTRLYSSHAVVGTCLWFSILRVCAEDREEEEELCRDLTVNSFSRDTRPIRSEFTKSRLISH